MGYLDEDASAITCVGLTATGTPVAHALQHGDGVHDQLVRFACFDVGDEAYTTGVFLKTGVI